MGREPSVVFWCEGVKKLRKKGHLWEGCDILTFQEGRTVPICQIIHSDNWIQRTHMDHRADRTSLTALPTPHPLALGVMPMQKGIEQCVRTAITQKTDLTVVR